ncbi:MAG: DUF3299 domain-containing protein [Planctomycetota bacterium]|jgi:hypothetical protein|nr:DUF3299 domain-containing protein [Planctomycetota bacterium]
MKVIWTIVVLLVLGGLIVLMQPHADERPGARDDQAFVDAAEQAIARAPAAPEGPKPVVNPAPLPSPDSTAAAPAPAKDERPVTPITGLDADLAVPASPNEPELKQLTRKDEKLAPSAEPAKPDPATVAAGQRFEPDIPPVAHAEILPSTFVKLADGSISADDAWTIRGSGTAEDPYEVSWEFLASAQDTYSPRLSENKIPARIAFLSGKRVRISGYLAFPLVAATSGECLLMLNQWDGCCIGIPPTPYDAIEVKLATEIKGWKKHTFNFGAIEGTFTVEPYLVENWLVGLYMMKDASLNREL